MSVVNDTLLRLNEIEGVIQSILGPSKEITNEILLKITRKEFSQCKELLGEYNKLLTTLQYLIDAEE
jgi:hypothetical protein